MKRFNGLNNVTDPLRLGLGWLKVADNVNISDDGAIERRDGYAPVAGITGNVTGLYSTRDFRRMYVVLDGSLQRVNEDMSLTLLRTGIGAQPMYWDEINDQVYYSNGVDKGVIYQDGTVRNWGWSMPGTPALAARAGRLPAGQYQVACTYLLPDGRETGAGDATQIDLAADSSILISSIPQSPGCQTCVYLAPANSEVFSLVGTTMLQAITWNDSPDQLGRDLNTQFLTPVPDEAVQLAFWQGRAYAMQYLVEDDITVLWTSEPLGFHLFNPDKYLAVRGKGAMLSAHKDALLIGTDRQILAWDGEKLAELANYGAVGGWSAYRDEETGEVFMWTQRGLCRALPFENLTSSRMYVAAPGKRAAGAVIRPNGTNRRFVAVLQKS